MQCANVPDDTIYLPDAPEAQADSRRCYVVAQPSGSKIAKPSTEPSMRYVT